VLRASKSEENSYPRVALWVTLLHCLYVITWYLQLGSRRSILGAVRFEFILAAGLTLIAVWHLLNSKPSPQQGKLLKAVAFFVVCILLALPFSYDFPMSWQIFVDRMIKFSFMGLFIVAFVRGPLQLWFFLAAFLLACMKIGQEGFQGIITGHMMWENQGVPRLHGTTGLFGHPNSLSGLALGTLPFVYYLFPLVRRPVKALLGLQAFFAVMIIIFTGSRTGYVGFMFFLFFLSLKSRYRVKLLAAMLILAAVLLNFAPVQYWQRFDTMFTGEDIEGKSMGSRKIIIDDAIEVFLRHPFGVGIAAFPKVRNMYFRRQQDTHNLYLEVATNLGAQGLIAFLIFIYVMMKGLRYVKASIARQLIGIEKINGERSPTRNRHINDLRLMGATADAVFVFLLIRLVVGLFGHDLYEIYWWFALGLTIALLNMNMWAGKHTEQLISGGRLAVRAKLVSPIYEKQLPVKIAI